MKKYKIRNGVVLVTVCNENLLIATKDARNHVPYVTQINDSAALWWTILESKHTLPEILEECSAVCGKEKNKLLLPWLTFLSKMEKSNYLISEDIE